MLGLLGAATVFGWTLGQPLDLPLCNRASNSYVYDPDQAICRDRYSDGPDVPFTRDFARFPATKRPAIMGEAVAGLQVDDGNLVGVRFTTNGTSDQDQVLRQLTAKFGKPSSIEHGTATTLKGATFPTLKASWRLADVAVDFDSARDRVDRGFVEITTPAERRSLDAASAAKAAARTPL